MCESYDWIGSLQDSVLAAAPEQWAKAWQTSLCDYVIYVVPLRPSTSSSCKKRGTTSLKLCLQRAERISESASVSLKSMHSWNEPLMRSTLAVRCDSENYGWLVF